MSDHACPPSRSTILLAFSLIDPHGHESVSTHRIWPLPADRYYSANGHSSNNPWRILPLEPHARAVAADAHNYREPQPLRCSRLYAR